MFLDAHTIDQFLHPLGTGLLHLFRYVTVAVQCKSGGEVSHVFLKGFDVIASLETIYGEGMPDHEPDGAPNRPFSVSSGIPSRWSVGCSDIRSDE